LVLVQSSRHAGIIKLKATSKTLKEAEVIIKAE